MHPTSLPGPYGIGDFGPEADVFLDWMRDAGFGLWQVLPLGPTGYGDSPYQCFSAFAGNPYLISPELLLECGLLVSADLEDADFPNGPVDFGRVIPWKTNLLRKAFDRFLTGDFAELRRRAGAFQRRRSVQPWLKDYALFMALKEANGGRSWLEWPAELRSRDGDALRKTRRGLAREIRYHIFVQYLFDAQWTRVRDAAHARGIRIVGDMPIYVALDSADTWAGQENFQLDAKGTPTHVAGVPPDYFSADGQLWGNPLYRWKPMEANGFEWWIARFRTLFEMFDVVRLDHFIGFRNYWSVKWGEKTARNGKWIEAPGDKLFDAVRAELGRLPVIAENLGVITDAVEELRSENAFPGMTPLQFVWGTKNPIPPSGRGTGLPVEIEADSVVYSGTHDNPTTREWYEEHATDEEHLRMLKYLGQVGDRPERAIMTAGFASAANTVIVPVQDLLGIGADGRMNTPGTQRGNWQWRLSKDALDANCATAMRHQLAAFGRVPNVRRNGTSGRPAPAHREYSPVGGRS